MHLTVIYTTEMLTVTAKPTLYHRRGNTRRT